MRVFRNLLMVVLVVAVGMGAAVGARAFVEARERAAKPAYPSVVTKAGPRAQRLTKTLKPVSGGFTVKAPPKAYVMRGGDSDSLLAVSLYGARDISAMLVVAKAEGLDPAASLRGNLPETDEKVANLRLTHVAGKPAATTTRQMAAHELRQYRFVFDNEMFAVAIAAKPGDRVAFDTMTAMLLSWRWTRTETPEDEL